MIQRAFLSAIAVLACVGAWASEPGQPLDCSDWVALEPGYACQPLSPIPCDSQFCAGFVGPTNVDADETGNSRAVTNDGNILLVRRVATHLYCGGSLPLYRLEVVRFDVSGEHVLGYFEERCNSVNVADQLLPATPNAIWNPPHYGGRGLVLFDDKNGRLIVPVMSTCPNSTPQTERMCLPYGVDSLYWLAGITGFATTFDVLQSYTPEPAAVGFRVPYMPEGMPAADYFDTYWGDLATVGNWNQAHGLECHYPASVPAVGDYLSVPDSLPIPQPGHGYYYVTAATYQGQTRYGRETNHNSITGRDPGVLPACTTSAPVRRRRES